MIKFPFTGETISMTQYSENEKLRLLSNPIENVLAACGKRTDHKGYMYYSPFRDEDAPSFHVDVRSNRWYDFGAAEGGGILDLVCRLKGCEKKDAFDILSEFDANFVHVDSAPALHPLKTAHPSSLIHIESVSDRIIRYALVEYALGERRIPVDVLNMYCKEVAYRIGDRKDSLFFTIGFPNNSGGYVLRSAKTKICSSSDITTLDRNGKVSAESSSKKAMVFEGFFDMLSWRALYGSKSLNCDVCVLSSVSNWKRSVDWLASHGKVCLCLDNDEAGRRAVADIAGSIKRLNGNLEVWDMSPSYSAYWDVGEKLESSPSARETRRSINP